MIGRENVRLEGLRDDADNTVRERTDSKQAVSSQISKVSESEPM